MYIFLYVIIFLYGYMVTIGRQSFRAGLIFRLVFCVCVCLFIGPFVKKKKNLLKSSISNNLIKKNRFALFEMGVRGSEIYLPTAQFSIHWLTNKEKCSSVKISAFRSLVLTLFLFSAVLGSFPRGRVNCLESTFLIALGLYQ